MIRIRGLTKTFSTDGNRENRVLRGIDLDVEAGEFVCLLGPTGCGKTTLLRLLVGLETPTAGEVRLEREAGMVFQQGSLLPWRRVVRNVSFPLEMKGTSRAEAVASAMEYLKLVDLEDAARAYPWELSGGMQQRAAIARALVGGREILLLDEPFGALDDRTRINLQQTLLGLWEERRTTILFVTHNIEEALVLADRIVVLGGGRILTDETVDLPRPRDRFDEDFVAALIRLRRAFARAV
jgi:ABC-type nitrate/sulfonate/bicarbonate transport system ATPase subunit